MNIPDNKDKKPETKRPLAATPNQEAPEMAITNVECITLATAANDGSMGINASFIVPKNHENRRLLIQKILLLQDLFGIDCRAYVRRELEYTIADADFGKPFDLCHLLV